MRAISLCGCLAKNVFGRLVSTAKDTALLPTWPAMSAPLTSNLWLTVDQRSRGTKGELQAWGVLSSSEHEKPTGRFAVNAIVGMRLGLIASEVQ